MLSGGWGREEEPHRHRQNLQLVIPLDNQVLGSSLIEMGWMRSIHKVCFEI